MRTPADPPLTPPGAPGSSRTVIAALALGFLAGAVTTMLLGAILSLTPPAPSVPETTPEPSPSASVAPEPTATPSPSPSASLAPSGDPLGLLLLARFHAGPDGALDGFLDLELRAADGKTAPAGTVDLAPILGKRILDTRGLAASDDGRVLLVRLVVPKGSPDPAVALVDLTAPERPVSVSAADVSLGPGGLVARVGADLVGLWRAPSDLSLSTPPDARLTVPPGHVLLRDGRGFLIFTADGSGLFARTGEGELTVLVPDGAPPPAGAPMPALPRGVELPAGSDGTIARANCSSRAKCEQIELFRAGAASIRVPTTTAPGGFAWSSAGAELVVLEPGKKGVIALVRQVGRERRTNDLAAPCKGACDGAPELAGLTADGRLLVGQGPDRTLLFDPTGGEPRLIAGTLVRTLVAGTAIADHRPASRPGAALAPAPGSILIAREHSRPDGAFDGRVEIVARDPTSGKERRLAFLGLPAGTPAVERYTLSPDGGLLALEAGDATLVIDLAKPTPDPIRLSGVLRFGERGLAALSPASAPGRLDLYGGDGRAPDFGAPPRSISLPAGLSIEGATVDGRLVAVREGSPELDDPLGGAPIVLISPDGDISPLTEPIATPASAPRPYGLAGERLTGGCPEGALEAGMDCPELSIVGLDGAAVPLGGGPFAPIGWDEAGAALAWAGDGAGGRFLVRFAADGTRATVGDSFGEGLTGLPEVAPSVIAIRGLAEGYLLIGASGSGRSARVHGLVFRTASEPAEPFRVAGRPIAWR